MMQTQSLHVSVFFRKNSTVILRPIRPRRADLSRAAPPAHKPSVPCVSGAPTHFQIKRLGPGFLRRKVAKAALGIIFCSAVFTTLFVWIVWH